MTICRTAIRLSAGCAGDLAGIAINHSIGQILAAILAVTVLVGLVWSDFVLTAVMGVSPGDLPAVRSMFEYLAGTALVNAVH